MGTFDVELCLLSELPPGQQLQVAGEVSEYTQTNDDLLPLTPEQVLGKHIGVVAMVGNKFAGYAGASAPNETGHSEAGPVWTKGDYQGRGIGGGLIRHITGLLVDQGVTPYAFANSRNKKVDGHSGSLNLFQRAGYVVAGVGEVPDEAFGACTDCALFKLAQDQGKLCHDTPVIFKAVEETV